MRGNVHVFRTCFHLCVSAALLQILWRRGQVLSPCFVLEGTPGRHVDLGYRSQLGSEPSAALPCVTGACIAHQCWCQSKDRGLSPPELLEEKHPPRWLGLRACPSLFRGRRVRRALTSSQHHFLPFVYPQLMQENLGFFSIPLLPASMALILKVWSREPLRELFSGVHDVNTIFVIVLRELPVLHSFSYECAVEPSRGCTTHARLSKKAAFSFQQPICVAGSSSTKTMYRNRLDAEEEVRIQLSLDSRNLDFLWVERNERY